MGYRRRKLKKRHHRYRTELERLNQNQSRDFWDTLWYVMKIVDREELIENLNDQEEL